MTNQVTVRELSADERGVYHTANLVAFEAMPYFADALFSVIPVAAPGLGTFAVDKHWRLYLDPARLIGQGAWSVTQVATALLHEVGHLLRVHADRAAVLAQPLSHLAWNYAADAEINDDLIDAGVVLPVDPVTPAALGCEPGGFAEDYYAAILGDYQDDPAPGSAGGNGEQADGGEASAGAASDSGAGGQAEFGCGSGSGCEANPGELIAEDTIGGRAGIDPATADLIREQVAIAVRDHAGSKGRGSVPAGMRRWADKVLTTPAVPWRRVLRVAIRRAVGQAAGRTDYSMARPSRRSRDVLFPGLRGPKIRVAIVVDTSGSMGSGDLAAALAEVEGVLRTAAVAREHVTVLTVDAAAAEPQRISRVRDIVLIGGGGTDMRVGIAAAEALRPAPHVVVVLGDGDTPWPESAGAAKLVCVIIGNDQAAAAAPQFATTVTIPSQPAAAA
ncbi:MULTISPECIES: vWA domain-containing protein [Mycolicibacter]|uniref:VWA-like domain-containing protein n=2 Tax=Mycolicibacter TaxID=1073531 RepID=A0ABU5XM58_9MYCO|nr:MULTISPECIES: VWA-like domain-containing protein [unclassified Mycolicibacter]MEB3023360.1 VWA-like domain-containing protein [Mycolicibacter sp. MYC098]MEB3033702.1 VWA-like domain-containing protein [Mycolicibacter sp. MYC340]